MPTGDVHVRCFGSGPPEVVLLHDSPGSGAALTGMGLALAVSVGVAVVDLPGHGATTVELDPDDPVGRAAATVVAVLRSLGVHGAVVAGTGVGAQVAAAVAEEAGDMCAMALVHGTSGPAELADAAVDPDHPVQGVGWLMQSWWHVRRAALFQPWWGLVRTADVLPSATELHEVAVDVMDRTAGPQLGHPAQDRHASRHRVAIPEWSATAISTALDDNLHRAVVPSPPPNRRVAPSEIVDDAGTVRHLYQTAGDRQIHLRTLTPSGRRPSARPVVILPSLPGSSAGVRRLLPALGTDRRVVALDYPGHGRSDPMGADPNDLEAYVDVIEETTVRLGLGRVDVFGVHSGALLAALWARHHPQRVSSLALEGVPLRVAFEDYDLERYLPDLAPDADGHHVLRAWAMGTDRGLWNPWYRQEARSARTGPGTSVSARTEWTTDLLRSASTYHLLYRLVLSYDLEALGVAPEPVPTLLCLTEGDALARYSDRAARLFPGARTEVTFGCATDRAADETATVLRTFFGRPTHSTTAHDQEHT